MCRRPRRIVIIIVAKGGEEGLKKGVVVVLRVTKNDDFDERVGFGTTGIGNMHHLYNGLNKYNNNDNFDNKRR